MYACTRAIGYIVPCYTLEGRASAIFAERERKPEAARAARECHSTMTRANQQSLAAVSTSTAG
jgi:hypothetical protein